MADKPVAPPRRDENQIAEEAARWFEALKTANHEQQVSFAAWLRQSSRHVHYFLHTTALDNLLNNVDPQRTFNIQNLIQQGRENVIPFETASASPATTNLIPGTQRAATVVKRRQIS